MKPSLIGLTKKGPVFIIDSRRVLLEHLLEAADILFVKCIAVLIFFLQIFRWVRYKRCGKGVRVYIATCTEASDCRMTAAAATAAVFLSQDFNWLASHRLKLLATLLLANCVLSHFVLVNRRAINLVNGSLLDVARPVIQVQDIRGGARLLGNLSLAPELMVHGEGSAAPEVHNGAVFAY